jgi:predicted transcriptional regulator
VRSWIESGAPGAEHQGYPVVDANGLLVGVLTRRNLFDAAAKVDQPVALLIQRGPRVVYEDTTARQAADHMVNHDIGRLPVISRDKPPKLVGFITRGDLLRVHARRLAEDTTSRTLRVHIRRAAVTLETASH